MMADEKKWAFNLRDTVRLVGSDERGAVIGRAEYSHAQDSYLVRYRAGDGRLCEVWWDVEALSK